MDKSIIEDLQKELAHVKRELEFYQNPATLPGDLYHSAKYWRERCLKVENELNAEKVMHADLRNRQIR